LDLTPLLSAIIPTLVGLITAQRLPDEIVPVKAEPSSAPERMTVVGASIVILTVVEAVLSKRPEQIDPAQFIAALGAVWAVLPRAHQVVDVIVKPFKKAE
jgi:hypothetical protein